METRMVSGGFLCLAAFGERENGVHGGPKVIHAAGEVGCGFSMPTGEYFGFAFDGVGEIACASVPSTPGRQ